MGLRFKSFRRGNIIGLTMIYPDGRCCNVMFAEVPVDGDWRADVDFYDEIETAYKYGENNRIIQIAHPIKAEIPCIPHRSRQEYYRYHNEYGRCF